MSGCWLAGEMLAAYGFSDGFNRLKHVTRASRLVPWVYYIRRGPTEGALVMTGIISPQEQVRIFAKELTYDPYAADVWRGLALAHYQLGDMVNAGLALKQFYAITRRSVAPPEQ